MKIKKIALYLANTINYIIKPIKGNKAIYVYKVAEIIEDEEEYTVVIKLANKNITFTATPEEILANDSLVDKFSPRDIRTLTYLGYLGINAPKYKILARKLSQTEKSIFLIKKKGQKKVITKTADQIIHESEIILNMDSDDAKLVGYTVGSETVIEEKNQKDSLLKAASECSKTKESNKDERAC